MPDQIEFNGTKYISIRRAAEQIDLSRDYMARLCKKNVIDAHRVGSVWYVDIVSVRAYLRAQDYAREYRRKKLAIERSYEYQNKSPVRIDKSVVPEVTEVLPVPVMVYATDAHKRMRRAIEHRSDAAFSALSESGRMPGVFRAALDLPSQALVHIPVHAISPTMELIHRMAALVSAFVLVFGTYSYFDPQYAHTAYDSVHDTIAEVVVVGKSARTAVTVGSDSTDITLAQFAHDPMLAIAQMRSSARQVYASATSLASSVYPQEHTSMAASAVLANPQITSTVLVQTVPVATADVRIDLAQIAAAAGANPADPTAVSSAATQPIAVAVQFTGAKVAYGDLVAYDAVAHTYTLTRGSDDATAYGVVIRDPALLFKPDGASDISVARSGSALMNVTLENGPIAQGDKLTSSSIPGKARKAKDGEHVIATASESFADGGVTLVAPNGSKFASGTISANISIAANSLSDGAPQRSCTSLLCSIDTQFIRALVRYLLSGVIAALTLTLAFKSFMSDANYGIISIGRNPLAKSTIRSLVLFNAVLALAIASAGLFAAMIVLFAG
jgi:hypothetical protein